MCRCTLHIRKRKETDETSAVITMSQTKDIDRINLNCIMHILEKLNISDWNAKVGTFSLSLSLFLSLIRRLSADPCRSSFLCRSFVSLPSFSTYFPSRREIGHFPWKYPFRFPLVLLPNPAPRSNCIWRSYSFIDNANPLRPW